MFRVKPGHSKTTTMLFKMFGIERAWVPSECAGPRPRQVFITKSRVLSEKVQGYFTELLRSLAQGSRVPSHVMESVRRWTERDQLAMVDKENDEHWHGDLPEKFSELEDKHFPLFITVHQVRI